MRLALAALGLAALGSLGCSGHYVDAMRPVHELARAGRPAEAFDRLEQQTRGTDWDALLVSLDEGALLHRAGRFQESAQALNRAVQLADDRETVSFSEEVFGKAPFRMAKHEKQALHALQALNYLQLGNVDEALVEARLTDLRQTKLAAEGERSRQEERFVTGNAVDEKQRAFFEQLVFGRYVSGLAYELEGQSDAAFIDYYRVYELGRQAPADARVRPAQLVPRLLRMARELGRPEAESLARENPGLAEESALGPDGELVVVVEAGFGPEVVLDERLRAYVLRPRERSTNPGYVVAAGAPWVPEAVSSLEELAERRTFAGVLVDRERSASVAINTVMFASYFVLFPVMMPLLIKRGYESGIRMGQSWLMLPAEFKVARLRLPAGKHVVQLPSLGGLVSREIEVRSGKLTLVVTEGP